MSQIYLPPIALYNAERERLTERHQHLKWFDRELKQLDRHLSLVKASEGYKDRDLIPGFWHIRRDNSEFGVPDSYLPITGPGGQFMEPHQGVLEQLRGGDLQREGAFDRLLKKHDLEELDRKRRLAEERADFKEEFALRYKAKANPGVSFYKGEGENGWKWKYRAGARNG